MHDYHTWTAREDDPYDPSSCGKVSLLFPGLGQMTAGEYGRGAAFMAGSAGCIIISLVGIVSGFSASQEYWGSPLAYSLIGVGLAGYVAIDIWSVVDAIRVAKVNNLVWRDREKCGFNLQIEPFIIPSQTFESTNTQVGLSFKINF